VEHASKVWFLSEIPPHHSIRRLQADHRQAVGSSLPTRSKMARKPNYRADRMERERAKAAKKAKRAEARAEKSEAKTEKTVGADNIGEDAAEDTANE
jgi:hypothetical protein